jgi:hypothetical protein
MLYPTELRGRIVVSIGYRTSCLGKRRVATEFCFDRKVHLVAANHNRASDAIGLTNAGHFVHAYGNIERMTAEEAARSRSSSACG